MPVVIKSKGFRRMVRLAKEAADHDFGFSLRDQLFVLRHGPAVDGLGVGYPELPVVVIHARLPSNPAPFGGHIAEILHYIVTVISRGITKCCHTSILATCFKVDII